MVIAWVGWTYYETEESEEQLEDMVDRIGQGEDVQIFSGFDFDEEQTKQIEERHNDLIELEKSLLELNEIFNEMAVMVESQEWINSLRGGHLSVRFFVEAVVRRTLVIP